MFNSLSINPTSITADVPEERPAKSSPPWVWFGFLFVAAFFTQEVITIVLELDESVARLFLTVLALTGWIYWLFCVHRFHKILNEVSANRYQITAAEAVWKHFIPFYNLAWVFVWPSTMSAYINRHGRVKVVSGNLLGAILLVSLLITRLFDGAIGLAGIFTVGMYLSAKLRRHIQSVPGSYQLPPLPDPQMFGPRNDQMPTVDPGQVR
jgi:hypothetical protein